MWVAQFYSFTKPRTLLTSGGLGTMGYGFPLMGRSLPFPTKRLVLVADEYSEAVITSCLSRLSFSTTAYPGMVRQWQELFLQQQLQFHQRRPARLCEAYGAEGYLRG